MVKNIIKKYSLAFKKQIIREYEQGASFSALQAQYGLGGSATIPNWVKKYSRQGVRHQRLLIQSPSEQQQVRVLQARVRQLEPAVAQLTLDKLLLETTLETVDAKLGTPAKKIPRFITEPRAAGTTATAHPADYVGRAATVS